MLHHSYEHLIFNPSLDIHKLAKFFSEEDFLSFFLYHNGDKDIFQQDLKKNKDMPSIKVFKNKELFLNVIRDFKLKELKDILSVDENCTQTLGYKINGPTIAIGLFKKNTERDDFFTEGVRFMIHKTLGIYLGDSKNSQDNGKGTVRWLNGDKYEGDFVNNQRTGKGIYTWNNDRKYEGDFVNNQRTGKGITTWPNGDKYEGDFVNNQRTGKGILTWLNGDKYEGDFVNGQPHGKGIFTLPKGNIYEGDFVNGQRTGKGILRFNNRDIYEGDFVNDEQTGKGIFTWKNGDKYEGDFVNGKPTKNGKFTKNTHDIKKRKRESKELSDNN